MYNECNWPVIADFHISSLKVGVFSYFNTPFHHPYKKLFKYFGMLHRMRISPEGSMTEKLSAFQLNADLFINLLIFRTT